MNKLLVFAYESGICLAIMYTIYWLLLRKETFFRFNRYYLLFIMAAAILLPLGNFRILTASAAPGQFYATIEEVVKSSQESLSGGNSSVFGTATMLKTGFLIIYLSGVLILLTRMIAGIYRILQLERKGKRVIKDGYSLIIIDKKHPPFSFGSNIFIHPSILKKQDHIDIINHELTHVRQFHSFDNLIVESFLAVFWINPFSWLLRRSIRDTHEYLADHSVSTNSVNSQNYQLLLLQQISDIRAITLANNFNSITKNRIKMMCRNKSGFFAKLKPILAIPALVGLFLMFSCSENNNTKQSAVPLEEIEILQSDEPEEDSPEMVFFVVEEMPKFNGDQTHEVFRTWIAENMQYPEKAYQEGISGKVYVQFYINPEGKVTHAKVVRGVDPLLDAEALRVVNSCPDWTPGKQRGQAVYVQFTFPINFVQ